MFNPFKPPRPICPRCKRLEFLAGGHGPLICQFCECPLRVPESYGRWIWGLTMVTLAAVGLPTYSSKHAGTWLLFLILLALPTRLFLGMLLPPWFEEGRQRFRFTFVVWYFTLALALPVSVGGLSGLHLAVGTKTEIQE